jgi:hypothetical protein
LIGQLRIVDHPRKQSRTDHRRPAADGGLSTLGCGPPRRTPDLVSNVHGLGVYGATKANAQEVS